MLVQRNIPNINCLEVVGDLSLIVSVPKFKVLQATSHYL